MKRQTAIRGRVGGSGRSDSSYSITNPAGSSSLQIARYQASGANKASANDSALRATNPS